MGNTRKLFKKHKKTRRKNKQNNQNKQNKKSKYYRKNNIIMQIKNLGKTKLSLVKSNQENPLTIPKGTLEIIN